MGRPRTRADTPANERRRRRDRQRWRKLRAQGIVELGGRCAVCGERDWGCLELHHRGGEGVGAAHRRAVGGTAGVWRDARREGWPREKYLLLCANCHKLIETTTNLKEIARWKT